MGPRRISLAEPPEPWFVALRWTVLPALRIWFRWRFEGLERIPRIGPALIACNHVSYLDPLANAYAVVRAHRRPRFLAKDDLFRAFGIRWAMRGTRQIPVARGTGDQSPLHNAETALRAGEAVLIYPEGTVTRRPDGLPMDGKTGAVRLALAAGVPIIPMVSWGSAPVWQKSGPGSLRPGRPVWVRVAAPFHVGASGVDVEDHEGVRRLTAELIETLTREVETLRASYPPVWGSR